MEWQRKHRGWYEFRDESGILWRIVQRASQNWQLIRTGASGHDVGPRWYSLADAKWYYDAKIRGEREP